MKNSVLLIARNRGFWSTDLCHGLFPSRIIIEENAGSIGQIIAALKGLRMIYALRPDVVVLGTSMKVVSLYAYLRSFGLLKNTKIISDKQFLKEREVRELDRIIIYSPGEKDAYPEKYRAKFVFVRYPSKSALVEVVHKSTERYIFAGGNHKRDFDSFMYAMGALPSIQAIVVTKNEIRCKIPENCHVLKPVSLGEYLSLMKGSMFVVVPLLSSGAPHGHCDLSNALSLGKPVITAYGASADNYVDRDRNGLLVRAGDVAAYQEAIARLVQDEKLLQDMSRYAESHAHEFSYQEFRKNLQKVIEQIV